VSAEATLAVMEHATGTDSEWRMLAVMANAANHHGIVMNLGAAELAERCGKTERGAGQILARLRKSGQLVTLQQGGGRGVTNIYWINLPGLPRPETPNQVVIPPSPNPEPSGDSPSADSGKDDPLPPTPPIPSTTTSSSSSAGSKQQEFARLLAALDEFDPTANPLADEITDGMELLRTGKKVDGKLVTPAEMAIAAAAVHAFNRCFEWKGRKEADYGLGANLKSIVMRARDRPSWDAGKHVRLVESAWRIRWWEANGSSSRRPTPNVIYGGNAFENVVQDAGAEAGGEKPAQIKKRRTRG
jgi:hypothetical protein